MSDPQRDVVGGANGPGPSSADHPESLEEWLPESLRAFTDPVRLREFIRSHPLPVVFGSLALGFAIARLLRED